MLSQLPPEYTKALLAGTNYLLKSLPSEGDIMRINDHQFWIRLNILDGPFRIGLFMIDTWYRQPRTDSAISVDQAAFSQPSRGYSDKYLIYFDRWSIPKVASVYCDLGQDQVHGGVFGYTIRLSEKDKVLHVAISKGTDWCLGGVIREIKLVEDY